MSMFSHKVQPETEHSNKESSCSCKCDCECPGKGGGGGGGSAGEAQSGYKRIENVVKYVWSMQSVDPAVQNVEPVGWC